MPSMPIRMRLHAWLISAALSILCLAFAGSSAFAAKPRNGGTGGGTINLVLLNSSDGLPHYGQRVTFDVSTSATTQPEVTLSCYQSGNLVYKATRAMFSGSLDRTFTLGSNSWTSGAAECTAVLQNWDNYSKHGVIVDLASTSFHAYA